jgi:hypothetical protein
MDVTENEGQTRPIESRDKINCKLLTMWKAIIISITFCLFVTFGAYSQTDSSNVTFLDNEIGVDGELDKSIVSAYYLRFFGKKNKVAAFAQLGGSLAENATKNYAFSLGGLWHLKPNGKSLTIGLKLYYQNISVDSEYYDGIGLTYSSQKGYELSVAPEFGYTFLIKDKIRIYPYVVPFAYSYVSGDNTKKYNYNSQVDVTDLSDTRSTISQSAGIKVGFRF